MKEYHKWLRKATSKVLTPRHNRLPRGYTCLFFQSAKLPSPLQAAVVYVNLHSKSNLTAQRLRRRVERGVAAARTSFNPLRLAWK